MFIKRFFTAEAQREQRGKGETCFAPTVGVILFLVALGMRLVRFESVPPGVQGDELFNLIDAGRIGWGNLPLFFEGNNGREPLYFYLLRLSIALFGESIWALRLPSALLGAGSAWIAWAIGRERFNWKVGLVTAGLVAVSLWPVLHGRLALRAVSLTFFGGMAILLWGRVLYGEFEPQGGRGFFRFLPQRHGGHGGIWAGVVLGLVLYTYIPGRIFGLIIVAWVIWMGLFERARLKERWRPILVAFGIAFIVMLPLLWYAFSTPELFNQRIESSGGQWQRGVPAVLGMFSVRGDSSWRYWIADRPLFNPIMSVLFYVGLLVCVWRSFVGKRRGVHLMVVAWMVNQVALNLMLGWMFLALRTAGAVIPVYLIVGVGVDFLTTETQRLWRFFNAETQREQRGSDSFTTEAQRTRSVFLVGVLMMLGVVGWGCWVDLGAWAEEAKVREIYRADLGEMGRYLNVGFSTAEAQREQRGSDSFTTEAQRSRRFLGVGYAYDAPTVVGLELYRPGAYSLYDVGTAVPLISDGELIVAKRDPLPPFGTWESVAINDVLHEIKLADCRMGGESTAEAQREQRGSDSFTTEAQRSQSGVSECDYVALYTSFKNGLSLIGFKQIDGVERGESVPLMFVFEVENGVGAANELVTLNVELMARGKVYAQHGVLIGYPQASWQMGDRFAQFTVLEIPEGIPAVPAQLRLTLSELDGTAIGGEAMTPLFDVVSDEVVEAYVPAEDTLIFSDTVALDSVTMSTLAAPGLSHDLALDWVPIAPITEPLTLTFVLVSSDNEGGTAVYTHTTSLGDETWPETLWRENERVTMQYRLNLPIDLVSRENELVLHLGGLCRGSGGGATTEAQSSQRDGEDILTAEAQREQRGLTTEAQRSQRDFLGCASELDVTNGESAISRLTLNIHERGFVLPDVANVMNYEWQDGISLQGYEVEDRGDTIKLTLVWQATAVPSRDYTVFNHLIAADGVLSGTLAAQLDAPPQHPASQTRTWQVGEVIVEERVIDVSGVGDGVYQLVVGMYDRVTIERLGVVGGGDSVVLGEIVR